MLQKFGKVNNCIRLARRNDLGLQSLEFYHKVLDELRVDLQRHESSCLLEFGLSWETEIKQARIKLAADIPARRHATRL